MNVQPFCVLEVAPSISATATSSQTQFVAGGVAASVLMIKNVGSNEAFFRVGVGNQTAVITDESIPAGAIMTYTKSGTANTVAAICASGNTTTLRISAGEGQ